uniref:PSII 6.1 kDa protein n=1 Tax=Oryza meridionalis TaxID=40149 RepID=A0A0E0DTN8_9ORYZ
MATITAAAAARAAVARPSGMPQLRARRAERLRCGYSSRDGKEHAAAVKGASSMLATAAAMTASSSAPAAMALVDERMSTEGTGLSLGLSNNLLGWILLGVFGLIWFNAKCSGAELSHLSARSTGAECRATIDGRPTRRADVSKFSATWLNAEVAKLSTIRSGAELRDIKAHPPRRESELSHFSPFPAPRKLRQRRPSPNPPLTRGKSRGFGGDFVWRLWSKMERVVRVHYDGSVLESSNGGSQFDGMSVKTVVFPSKPTFEELLCRTKDILGWSDKVVSIQVRCRCINHDAFRQPS